MATARKSISKSLAKSPPIKRIIARLEMAHPAAKLDLDFTHPLALLVALTLAAQARDRSNCTGQNYFWSLPAKSGIVNDA